MSRPALDGRAFGDPGPDVVLLFREDGAGAVEAGYAGGGVRRGHLVGTRTGDALDLRYAELRDDGTTASGRWTSAVIAPGDGRLVLEASWDGECGAARRTGRLVELVPAPEAASPRPIGWVRGGRAEVRDDDWGPVAATIRLDERRFGAAALRGLEAFSHVEVLYRFHRVDPAGVHTGARRPRGNPAWPEAGIFAQRAKDRPNRIGSTICRLVAVHGTALDVLGLDAVDGTPVLDLKPCMREFLPRETVTQPAWATELMRGYW